MDNEEMEAYLRKHTLNGAMRDLHEKSVILGCTIVRDIRDFWTHLLEGFGLLSTPPPIELSDEFHIFADSLARMARAGKISIAPEHQEIEPYRGTPCYEEMLFGPADWSWLERSRGIRFMGNPPDFFWMSPEALAEGEVS